MLGKLSAAPLPWDETEEIKEIEESSSDDSDSDNEAKTNKKLHTKQKLAMKKKVEEGIRQREVFDLTSFIFSLLLASIIN